MGLGAATENQEKAKMRFQSCFMSTSGPAIEEGGVPGQVEPAKCRLAVIGVFTLGVGMMDDAAQTRRPTRLGGPLQHFEIAVRIAEGGDRPPPDKFVDSDRLARLVVDEVDFRQPKQPRYAVPCLIRVLMLDPITCSGGTP